MPRVLFRGLCPCFLSGEQLSRPGKAASFLLGLCRTVVWSTTRTRHSLCLVRAEECPGLRSGGWEGPCSLGRCSGGFCCCQEGGQEAWGT